MVWRLWGLDWRRCLKNNCFFCGLLYAPRLWQHRHVYAIVVHPETQDKKKNNVNLSDEQICSAREARIITMMIVRQIAAFVLTGLLNTVVGYGLYAFFIYVGLNYVQSLTVATAIGILFNFKSLGTLVFKSNDNRLLGKFLVVYVILFLINLLVISVLVKWGMGDYLAGMVSIVFVSVLSFLVNKFYVFAKKGKDAGVKTEHDL